MARRGQGTRLLLRSLFVQGSWNYRALVGTGLGWALLGAREALGDAPREAEAEVEWVERVAEPFNSHPYLATIALGALTRAERDRVNPERVRSFRQALRSPLGGLGDGLIWGGWRPTCLLAAMLAALLGASPIAVVVGFLVSYNAVHLALRVRGLRIGSELGLGVAAGIRDLHLPEWTERIRWAGVLLLGLVLGVLVGRGAGSIGWASGWLLGAFGLFLAGLAMGDLLRRWGPGLLILLVILGAWFPARGASSAIDRAEETVGASDSEVQERRVRVRNRLGLHARPAAEFVKIATRYKAEIHLSKDGLTVNGKSIMGVLMLAAERGTELVIRCEGPDAAEAAEVLGSFVDQGFKEA